LRSLVEPTEVGWDMAPAANRWRGVAVGSMPAVRTGPFPLLGHASIGAARTLLPLPARMMPLVGRG